MEIRPISDSIGSEVRGIDVSRPLRAADLDRMYQAWIDTSILLFRRQKLLPQQQIDFSRQFGEVGSYTRNNFALDDYSEILVLSNITREGKLIGSPVSGRVWHTDGHYLETPPAGSLLYAIEVPPQGGDTWFANTRAAYEALPAALRAKIDDLKVIISRVQSRPYNYPERGRPTEAEVREWTDMAQPMVLTHPVSGKRALYAGGSVPWRVEGMTQDDSDPLVTFVQEFSTRPQFTYRHQWRAGDMILWDNRSAMHRATKYDSTRYRRLMHRTTISGSNCRPLPVNALLQESQ